MSYQMSDSSQYNIYGVGPNNAANNVNNDMSTDSLMPTNAVTYRMRPLSRHSSSGMRNY